ncbi:MAG: hypothetical protein JWN44_608 [Myxococcales bacterium]|nr:hypothetical protein [Myxococcales bacterium]
MSMVAAINASGRRVLVCDADRQRAATIGALVAFRRHAVRLVHDAREVGAACLAVAPDVLVFELSLGAEAAELVGAWLTEHAPAVRRVFVCATAAEAAPWLRRRIAHHTLLRPIAIHELWTFVESP